MPFTSVNTNNSAYIALQNLNDTQNQLLTTQNRVSTGLKVASAKDDSAAYQIAQTLRGNVAGISSVTDSLNRAKSTLDVAVSGGQSISDLLVQARGIAASAQDSGLDKSSRAALASDFKNLISQIDSVVQQSEFNGVNLLKANPDSISALTAVGDASKSIVSRISVGGFEADSKANQAGVNKAAGTITVAAGATLRSLLNGTQGGQAAYSLINGAYQTNPAGLYNGVFASQVGGSGNFVDNQDGSIYVNLQSSFTGGTININLSGVSFTTKTNYGANTTGGTQLVKISADDLVANTGGTFNTLQFGTSVSTGAQLATLDLNNLTDRTESLALVDQFSKAINDQLSTFGSASRQIDLQLSFAQKLGDNLNSGIGNIVDANLSQESAKLQGLNVRQQLGVQALSLANQGPQSLLSLFR